MWCKAKIITRVVSVALLTGCGPPHGTSSSDGGTSSPTVPTAPQAPVAVGGNGSIALSWAAPSSNGGSPVTGYNLYRGTSPGSESSTPIGSNVIATSYTDTGLTNGTAYYYNVAAVNSVGVSPQAGEVSAVPHVSAPPGSHLFGIGLSSVSNISEENGDAAAAGHHLDVMNFFESFGTGTPSLITTRLNEMSANQTNGTIPMFTWMSCSFAISGSCGSTGTAYPLANIAAGQYDSYIKSVADAIKAYGGPAIIRLDHEMNGGWYPWGNTQGNTPAQYVAAWQDVHHVFTADNVTNVKWLWCPNVNGGHSPQPYYPGDSYVDYVGEDGYNRPSFGPWRTPSQIFGASLAYETGFAPTKPIIIGEVGTVESTSTWGTLAGQDKTTWITDFVSMLKSTPNGYGFVWSEWSGNEMDTSSAAMAAMTAALKGF
jgi:hypothetical protein